MDKVELTHVTKAQRRKVLLLSLGFQIGSSLCFLFVFHKIFLEIFPAGASLPRFLFLSLGLTLCLPFIFSFKEIKAFGTKNELRKTAPQAYFDDLALMRHKSGEDKNYFYREILRKWPNLDKYTIRFFEKNTLF